MNRLRDESFVLARLIVYATTLILLLVMELADPFHYACNAPGIVCPGCGFKTAVWYLASGNLLAAYNANVLIVPAMIVAALALADVVAIAVWWNRAKRNN